MQNRYAIYDLMGQNVSFRRGRREVSGLCRRVYRDVFRRRVVVVVQGECHYFPEPDVIRSEPGRVVLCYGKDRLPDDEERDFWRRLHANAYRESLQEIFQSANDALTEVVISYSPHTDQKY